MATFRKKPVVVDAVQWVKDGDHPSVQPLHLALVAQQPGPPPGFLTARIARPAEDRSGRVVLADEQQVVQSGDWIVTTAAGERYVVAKDAFDLAYEVVE